MLIGNTNIETYGAHLLDGYAVSSCEIDYQYYRGRNRSSFTLLYGDRGLKEISIELEFAGRTRRAVMLNRSNIEALMSGKFEMKLPDGFFYACVLKKAGELSLTGVDGQYVVGKIEYVLFGYQHDPLETIVGQVITCKSTVPRTDCIIISEVEEDTNVYSIGGVVFTDVEAGDVLTVDGINGRILVNGVPAANRAEWLEFPHLVPGVNTIIADGNITVKYYPTYL